MRKQKKMYRAPSIMPSESVAADIGGIGSDDRHIIVGKGGSDDHEDVKMSKFIRPWAALSRDSSAPPGGISRSSFRDGESKKKSWWQMFLPAGENGDEVEVSGIPAAQDEGLSRMSSLDSLSHEVRLKSIQSSDFKVYMRSSSEGAGINRNHIVLYCTVLCMVVHVIHSTMFLWHRELCGWNWFTWRPWSGRAEPHCRCSGCCIIGECACERERLREELRQRGFGFGFGA